jgi:hypothetical protein
MVHCHDPIFGPTVEAKIITKMFADLREAKALWAPAAPLMLTSLYAVWVPTPIAIEVRARVLAEQVSRSSRLCLGEQTGVC